MKAGAVAALKADDERKAVAACVPYLQAFHSTVDPAELHDAPHISPTRQEGDSAWLSRKMQRC